MKPFEVVCIKPFNVNRETDAWGYLKLLEIYLVTGYITNTYGKKLIGVFGLKWVKSFSGEEEGEILFHVATHKKFKTDETVPIFREHLRKL